MTTIAVWQEELFEGQPGAWAGTIYAEHPEYTIPEAPAGKGLLVSRNDGLDAEEDPPFLYASVGDGCLESPIERSIPDIPNVQPVGNDLALPVGQHSLEIHGEPPIGEFPTCKDKPLGPGVPITVNAGDRLLAFPYRLSGRGPDEHTRHPIRSCSSALRLMLRTAIKFIGKCKWRTVVPCQGRVPPDAAGLRVSAGDLHTRRHDRNSKRLRNHRRYRCAWRYRHNVDSASVSSWGMCLYQFDHYPTARRTTTPSSPMKVRAPIGLRRRPERGSSGDSRLVSWRFHIYQMPVAGAPRMDDRRSSPRFRRHGRTKTAPAIFTPLSVNYDGSRRTTTCIARTGLSNGSKGMDRSKARSGCTWTGTASQGQRLRVEDDCYGGYDSGIAGTSGRRSAGEDHKPANPRLKAASPAPRTARARQAGTDAHRRCPRNPARAAGWGVDSRGVRRARVLRGRGVPRSGQTTGRGRGRCLRTGTRCVRKACVRRPS